MTFKEFIYKRYPHLNYEGENPVVEFSLDDIIKLQQEFEQNCIKHGVMQGCQCETRIGETTVWCCNQCGLPCENGWLPAHKPIQQPTVADGAAGKTVRGGKNDTWKKGDELYGG